MTQVKEILDFLEQLAKHNDRQWFGQNKGWYDRVHGHFAVIVTELIERMSAFDSELQHLQAKDCIFRIYRDIRFSPDKSPYKRHFGAFIASGGGRRSPRGGYYLHLQPAASILAAGVWCPDAVLLKALRQSVYDNIDELEDILQDADFLHHFGGFHSSDALKTVPKNFPKDFPRADLLKLKQYVVECPLPWETLASDDFVDRVAQVFRSACPLNRFLNYTVDEHLG